MGVARARGRDSARAQRAAIARFFRDQGTYQFLEVSGIEEGKDGMVQEYDQANLKMYASLVLYIF